MITKPVFFLSSHFSLWILRIRDLTLRHLWCAVVELGHSKGVCGSFSSVLVVGFISTYTTLIDLPLLFASWFCSKRFVPCYFLTTENTRARTLPGQKVWTQYKDFFLENGWRNRFYRVPWRSTDLSPHQSMAGGNSRVRGLNTFIFFTRVVKSMAMNS